MGSPSVRRRASRRNSACRGFDRRGRPASAQRQTGQSRSRSRSAQAPAAARWPPRPAGASAPSGISGGAPRRQAARDKDRQVGRVGNQDQPEEEPQHVARQHQINRRRHQNTDQDREKRSIRPPPPAQRRATGSPRTPPDKPRYRRPARSKAAGPFRSRSRR